MGIINLVTVLGIKLRIVPNMFFSMNLTGPGIKKFSYATFKKIVTFCPIGFQ